MPLSDFFMRASGGEFARRLSKALSKALSRRRRTLLPEAADGRSAADSALGSGPGVSRPPRFGSRSPAPGGERVVRVMTRRQPRLV